MNDRLRHDFRVFGCKRWSFLGFISSGPVPRNSSLARRNHFSLFEQNSGNRGWLSIRQQNGGQRRQPKPEPVKCEPSALFSPALLCLPPLRWQVRPAAACRASGPSPIMAQRSPPRLVERSWLRPVEALTGQNRKIADARRCRAALRSTDQLLPDLFDVFLLHAESRNAFSGADNSR